MSFGAPFGGDATQFGGLSPETLAYLQQLQALQQVGQEGAQQPAPAAQGPGSPDALLYNRAPMGGGLNPFVSQGPATTGSTVPVAMTEADTRQMERAMMPDDARTVPLPPSRPSDADLMAPAPAPRVDGMNPGRSGRSAVPGMPSVTAQPSVAPVSTGNPENSNVAPVNAFDPLTGQPVSGSPKLMRAPGEGGPTEGGGRVAAAAGRPAAAGDDSGGFLKKFADGLNNPQVGNLLLNVGIGLMSQRGFGPGIAAGLQQYQAGSTGNVKQQLEILKYQQALKGQQDLAASLKARGLPDHVIAAAVSNPTVLSDALGSLKPNLQTIGGYVYDLNKGGGVPGDANRIGLADRPDEEKLAYEDKKKDIEDKHREDTLVEVTEQGTGRKLMVNKSAIARAMEARAKGGDGSGATAVGGTPAGVEVTPYAVPVATGLTPAQEEEQRGIGKIRSGVLSSAVETGESARKRIPVIDQMAAAIDRAGPNMITGPLAGSVLQAKQALNGLGIPVEGLSGQEMLNSLGPVLAGEAAKGITSQPALAEFKSMLMAKPGQQYSVEANKAILDVYRQNAVRDQHIAELAENNSHADFVKKRDAYLASPEAQLINPFTQKPFGSASGSGAGQSLATTGDKQAPVAPAARFQQLIQGGMSKADAYAQMHKEGL